MARSLDRSTREARLEALRRQNADDAKRARTLAVVAASVAVVLVLAVLVAVALSRWAGGDDQAAPVRAPAGTTLVVAGDPDSGGFVVGEPGDVELVVYEDYRCPACRDFEAESGEYLGELAAGTDVTVVRRPIAILDGLGDGYSTRAAAAAACVGETGDDAASEAWGAQVLAEQPAEDGQGLSDDRLVAIASETGLDVASCVADGTYLPWAGATTASAGESLERLSTPTLVLDGEVVVGEQGFPTTEELSAAVDAAVTGSDG